MRAIYQRTTSVTVYLWLPYSCSNRGIVTSIRSRSMASCEAPFLFEQQVMRIVTMTRRRQQPARIFMRSFERNECLSDARAFTPRPARCVHSLALSQLAYQATDNSHTLGRQNVRKVLENENIRRRRLMLYCPGLVSEGWGLWL